MSNEKKIILARENWLKAARELGFRIETPFNFNLNGSEHNAFAFLPNFGSLNGTIIDVIFPPNFGIQSVIKEWAKINNCHYSFINIEGSLTYNIDNFIEMLGDWGKF